MASTLIHLTIAKLLKNDLHVINEYDYYLGSIAPDLGKHVNLTKDITHFETNDLPNLDKFISKYKNYKYNDFLLGYFIHLYTDKIWFKDFLPNLNYNSSLKLLDGTIINSSEEEIKDLIYNDYTNVNSDLIDTYNLDLSLFYEPFRVPDTTLTEIPITKLNILVDKMGIIIENSNKEKQYLFDINTINAFINKCVKEIGNYLK